MNPGERNEAHQGLDLGEVSLFRGLAAPQLNALAAIGRRQVYLAGDVLARQGSPAEALYCILRGEVGRFVSWGTGNVPLETLGPGSVIPLVAMVDPPVPLVTTLLATTEVEAFVFPREPLMQLVGRFPALAIPLYAKALAELARRYQSTLSRVAETMGQAGREREQRVQSETEKVHDQLLQSGRLAVLGEVVADAAHEINDSLSGAAGLVELLLEGAETGISETAKRDLELVYRGTRRATEVVRRLMAFAPRGQQRKTVMSINEAVKATLGLRQFAMGVNNVQVVLDLQPDLPLAEANPDQVQQVFLNLILNAEQAMVEAHGRGVLLVKTRQVQGGIQVTLSDDGPGIPKENQERIFEPFFTTKGDGKGTGLGLTLCREFLEEQGGTISVQSEEGLGAAFIVELPAKQAPSHARSQFTGVEVPQT